jgi:baculoviral IAP repeat-containing protein 6
LILIEDPFFNEPGFEATRGTQVGTKRSNEYNRSIRQHTMRWAILEQLRDPPRAFVKVVRAHYRLKAQDVVDVSC